MATVVYCGRCGANVPPEHECQWVDAALPGAKPIFGDPHGQKQVLADYALDEAALQALKTEAEHCARKIVSRYGDEALDDVPDITSRLMEMIVAAIEMARTRVR